jgi:uncharacterized UBP type Zn finger protein
MEIEKEILKLSQPVMKNPYYLHAIMNHEGSSEFGHYYSFIFDRKAKQWYKFNDHKVTKVEEAEVLSESYGDNKSSQR